MTALESLEKHGYKIRCLRCCLNCFNVWVDGEMDLQCNEFLIEVDDLGICNKFIWNERFRPNKKTEVKK